jgi:hypothetical protein
MHLAVGSGRGVIIDIWFIDSGFIKVTAFTKGVQHLLVNINFFVCVCVYMFGGGGGL